MIKLVIRQNKEDRRCDDLSYINQIFTNIRLRDIIDILLVAMLFYRLFMMIKETRAEQLTKGIVILLVLTKLSDWAELFTINWILEKTMTVGTLALLIVFQPELRRGLEYIGRGSYLSKSLLDMRGESLNKLVEEMIEAVGSLSRQKIGALIVIERKTGLNEVVETGTKIDGYISSNLLINIFIPNTPLHDGAVIIKEDKIKAAACFLPLTDNADLNPELGTRHRAAIGISEKSDSLAVVVSEETGGISVAENGKIARHLDLQTLEKILLDMYKIDEDRQSFITKWRLKNEQEE